VILKVQKIQEQAIKEGVQESGVRSQESGVRSSGVQEFRSSGVQEFRSEPLA
jgi:hypothetical protein